jgi:RNA polymerase sigma factor (sigma-70 family)
MRLNRLPLWRVSDAQLIAHAGDGPAGFSELYTRHAAEVHAWLSLSRDRFQDTHEGSALPWLLGIARNVLLETARADRIETRARERLGLPLDLATEDGFTEVEDRLSPRLLLDGQLDTLPTGEREALQLRVIDELSYEEVAEQLHIRPTAARLRVSRALRRLAHTTPEENV